LRTIAWTQLIRTRPNEPPRLLVRGIHLHYQLQQYQQRRASSAPTWDLAYCDGAEVRGPAPINLLNQTILDPRSLNIMSVKEAGDRFPRLRGKLRSWEEVRSQLLSEAAPASREDVVHRALTLTQFLDALYAATEVFPVDLIDRPTSESAVDHEVEIWLRPRVDTDRESLSTALGLRPLLERLSPNERSFEPCTMAADHSRVHGISAHSRRRGQGYRG
jgi:hypothetical protein